MDVYTCPQCNTRSPSLSQWMSHLRLVHHLESEVRLSCPVDKCDAVYTKVNSMCSHIYRAHKATPISSLVPAKAIEVEHNPDVQEPSVLFDLALSSSVSHDVDLLLSRDTHKQMKKSMLFLLQLKEERLLTQVAINDVVAGCSEVFHHTVCRLRAGVSQKLAQSGIDSIDISGLDSVFDDTSYPFAGLETSYLQEKFVLKELGCIEPVEVKVGGSHFVTRQSGAKRRKLLTRDTFYYIPLLHTLKQLLQIQSVRNEVLRQPLGNNNNLFHDFTDGKIYKDHSLFKDNPNSLQVVAYYDEVETCNPLGSSSGKYKLGCVFFTLSNIRPVFRSGLKAIFLLVVAKSSTIKIHGIDTIFKPFLEDLKILHDVGIKMHFAGKEEVWKGSLLAFLADNLAAHELGGFKESFSFARRFCRSCLTNKEFSQSHFREDQFVIRNRTSHAQHCNDLEGPNRLEASVEYGINRRSSLDSIPNFSVVANMPHDIMHDLFEGIIPYEFKLLLHHCTRKSYFTISTLNNRLRAFDFGYSELGDKPAPIGEDIKVRQTASQMWLIARIFPLLVGDLILRDDNNWKCFLKLLEICEICAATELSTDDAAYLSILIEEHHSQFKILYKESSIIPKMHFMVHYPKQILNFGPLIHTWTMRHEAKLRVIKRAARVSNFKNVCQTVAKRHQHLLCFYIHTDQICTSFLKIGPCKQHCITVEKDIVRSLLAEQYQLTEESILFTSSYVTYNGITYKPNSYILLSYDALLPLFGKISTIIKTDREEILLVLKEFSTVSFDSHYRAFCITEHLHGSSHRLCSVRNLPYHNIYHLRRTFAKDSKLYLTFKCLMHDLL